MIGLQEIGNLYGLEYKKPVAEDNDHWFGVIAPMISLTIAFKHRLGEVKVVPKTFKVGSGFADVSLEAHGISRNHACLMEGMTFPPAVRSSIVQTLGPATTVMCLVTARGQERYNQKWVKALSIAVAFKWEVTLFRLNESTFPFLGTCGWNMPWNSPFTELQNSYISSFNTQQNIYRFPFPTIDYIHPPFKLESFPIVENEIHKQKYLFRSNQVNKV